MNHRYSSTKPHTYYTHGFVQYIYKEGEWTTAMSPNMNDHTKNFIHMVFMGMLVSMNKGNGKHTESTCDNNSFNIEVAVKSGFAVNR